VWCWCVAELREGYKWLTEGALEKRKVDPEEPTSKTMWAATPKPLVPGKTATLLYNSKATSLSWIVDKRPANKKSE